MEHEPWDYTEVETELGKTYFSEEVSNWIYRQVNLLGQTRRGLRAAPVRSNKKKSSSVAETSVQVESMDTFSVFLGQFASSLGVPFNSSNINQQNQNIESEFIFPGKFIPGDLLCGAQIEHRLTA